MRIYSLRLAGIWKDVFLVPFSLYRCHRDQ